MCSSDPFADSYKSIENKELRFRHAISNLVSSQTCSISWRNPQSVSWKISQKCSTMALSNINQHKIVFFAPPWYQFPVRNIILSLRWKIIWYREGLWQAILAITIQWYSWDGRHQSASDVTLVWGLTMAVRKDLLHFLDVLQKAAWSNVSKF